MTGLRADHRAVPVYGFQPGCVRVMGEDQLAPVTQIVIGAEKQAGQRVGVDVALEPHSGPLLNIEYEAVPVIVGGHHGFVTGPAGQVEEVFPVKLVQPRQLTPDLVGVDTAAGDMCHLVRFAGQDRGP